MTRISSLLTSLAVASLLLVVSLMSLVLVFVFTSPLAVGPVGAMAVFLLLYVCFFASFLVAVHAFFRIRYHHNQEAQASRPQPDGRVITAAAAWAIAPIILLALHSIGQLDGASVFLLALFELLATVYVFRR